MVKQIHTLTFSFFLLNLLLFSQAHADEFKSSVVAKMTKQADTYLLQFSDGREAQVHYQTGNLASGTVYMRQIENTCQPSLPLVRCQMEFDLKPYKLDLRWTKNPDPSRVGKTVIVTDHYSSPPKEVPVAADVNSLSWYYLYSTQATDQMGLRPDRLNCENFDWLMQSENLHSQVPSQVMIQSWGGEAMIPNEETKIAENMTIGGSKGVQLQRVGQKSYQISGIQMSYPGERPGNFPPFISAQVSNMTFYSSAHKKYCQVSFEMNITKIVALISSQEYNKVNPETLKASKLDFWHYQDFFLPMHIRNLTRENSKYEAK